MKIIFFLALTTFCTRHVSAQDVSIPPNAKTILVRGITFKEICSALLDSGYTIEVKDNDLLMARTEPKIYPKYWNGAYKISVRVKDSTAIFSGVYKCPYQGAEILGIKSNKDPWYDSDFIYHHVSRKGKEYPKSMMGYPFLLMNQFAKGFGKPLTYR